MRKTLLASAAILGATGGLAFAQTPAPTSQGQLPGTWSNGPAINNNMNTVAHAVPGADAIPTPGTVIIRLNGGIWTGMDANFTSLDKGNTNNTGANNPSKLNPISAEARLWLYPGIDGMASNGLRYGAAAEIRENFMSGTSEGATGGTSSGTGAASASGNTSSQTLFMRRAFTYISSDQFGLVRLGQGDGIVGLWNNGLYTTGSYDGGVGNLNNGGFQATTPNLFLLDWPFFAGNGTEYGNNKVVYLTPQFAGFDFGVEYAPNMGNSYSESVTSSPYQLNPCPSTGFLAGANCVNISSGGDGTRWLNRVAVGARYQGTFGGLALSGYGMYVTSGKETTTAAVKYDNLNLFNGGIAATFAGFTLSADATSGRTNASNGLVATGGAPTNAAIFGLQYANGPWVFGSTTAFVDNQGSGSALAAGGGLLHVSQRHSFATAVGGTYKLAPGINLVLEYQYEQKWQGGFNFNQNGVNTTAGVANGSSIGNMEHGQGVTFYSVVSW